MKLNPQIYVACLASYNNGVLHGAWIDATQEPDDISEAIQDLVLKTSKIPDAEEYAIHDYDDFPGLDLGESADLETVSMHAQMLVKHGMAWSDYATNVGTKYATEDGFDESFCGEYPSAEDYAEQLLDDCGDLNALPENLRRYFDYAKFARDLSYDGYSFIKSENGVYVFRSC